MKNLSILLCLVGLFLLADTIHAQDDRKSRSIGIQANPYLDSYFFEGTSRKYVYALRYGFNIKDHISLGPEISGYFRHHDNINLSALNLGGFLRYSVLPASRIRPFIEFSPYYTIFHYKVTNLEGVVTDDTYFSGYVSPGISLHSKNHKFSLDLMYKFSVTDKPFANNNQSVFSYRFNFNF